MCWLVPRPAGPDSEACTEATERDMVAGTEAGRT